MYFMHGCMQRVPVMQNIGTLGGMLWSPGESPRTSQLKLNESDLKIRTGSYSYEKYLSEGGKLEPKYLKS